VKDNLQHFYQVAIPIASIISYQDLLVCLFIQVLFTTPKVNATFGR